MDGGLSPSPPLSPLPLGPSFGQGGAAKGEAGDALRTCPRGQGFRGTGERHPPAFPWGTSVGSVGSGGGEDGTEDCSAEAFQVDGNDASSRRGGGASEFRSRKEQPNNAPFSFISFGTFKHSTFPHVSLRTASTPRGIVGEPVSFKMLTRSAVPA